MNQPDTLLGATLGRYRLEALYRRGPLASIYRAVDSGFERTVAVKVINRTLASHPGFVALFLRECRATARLQHPHILPVYDVGEQDGVPYLVMQYIEGGNLRDRFDDPAAAWPMPVAAATDLLRPIALALDYAHGQGVIHRDVKPSNILLGSHGTPFLTDFSLAKVLQEQGTAVMTFAEMRPGTPEYMSPEQGRSLPLDGRSDLYSLAIVIYEALTGRTPFQGDAAHDTPVSIIIRHLTAAPPAPRELNPAISTAVELVLLRALAKEPQDRYPTGAALFDALMNAQFEPNRDEIAAPTGDVAADGLEVRPSALPISLTSDHIDSDRASDPPGETPLPATALITAGAAGDVAATDAPAAITPIPDTSRPVPSHGDGATIAGSPVAYQRTEAGSEPSAPSIGARRARQGLSARSQRSRRYLWPATILASLAALLLGGWLISAFRADSSVTGPEPPASPTAQATALALASPAATARPSPAAAGPNVPGTPTTTVAAAPTPAPGVAATGGQEVILFASTRGAAGSQVHLMRPDGREQQQLIIAAGPSSTPRIAPDGRSFLFSVAPGASAAGAGSAGSANHYIYIARSDGSSINELSNRPSYNAAWSWSPDGRWVTFVSDRDGNWEIYKVTPAGEQLTRLTANPGRDGWPVWSPDGRSIIFVSDRDGRPQLYLMDGEGGSQRRLITSETNDLDPAISPDGRMIAFSAQNPDGKTGDIVVAAIDGSNPVRLTRAEGMNIHPAWSPDGRRLAFASNRAGNYEVYRVDSDGGGLTRLTDHPGDDTAPDWGSLRPQ